MLATAWVMAQGAGCKAIDPDLLGTYTGACRDGLADGMGVARGRSEYSGEFRSGHRHGFGVLRTPEGDEFEGRFENGRSVDGTYVWSLSGPRSGERYTGGFKEGLRHGHGTHFWPGGDSYSGEWHSGHPIGRLSEAMVRRFRAYSELAAAIKLPGTRVCRQVPLGIAERHSIQGVVVGLANERIRVRLERLGAAGIRLHGTALAPGIEIQDDFLSWVPCA